MSTLASRTPADTFKDLLQVSNSNAGVDTTVRNVEDGEGTASALAISTRQVQVNGTAGFVPAIVSVPAGFASNLQEWQVDGSAVASITAAGVFTGGISSVNADNITSGTLAVARGGTGANTAADARTSLAVPGLAVANTFTATQIIAQASGAGLTINAPAGNTGFAYNPTGAGNFEYSTFGTQHLFNISNSNIEFRTTNNAFNPSGAQSFLFWNNVPTTRKVIVVRGTSGQSASLHEWQNSSEVVLASVSAAGLGHFTGLTTASGSTLGFFGATAVVKQAALDGVNTDIANSGDMGTDGVIDNTRTRLEQLEARLVAYGLIPAS